MEDSQENQEPESPQQNDNESDSEDENEENLDEATELKLELLPVKLNEFGCVQKRCVLINYSLRS